MSALLTTRPPILPSGSNQFSRFWLFGAVAPRILFYINNQTNNSRSSTFIDLLNSTRFLQWRIKMNVSILFISAPRTGVPNLEPANELEGGPQDDHQHKQKLQQELIILIIRSFWTSVSHIFCNKNHFYNHHHQSILTKGKSFSANSETKAAILPKSRSSIANSGT